MRRSLPAVVAALALLGSLAAAPEPASAKDKEQPAEHPAVRDFGEKYASQDAAIRSKAVESLYEAPDAAKLELISSRVVPKEKRADVLARAVEVLARIKEEKVATAMIPLTRTGTAEQKCVYIEAMAAMVWCGPVHRALLELLKDKEPWVRGMAAYSLGEHHASDAIDPLLALLGDRAWQVQAAALGGLTRISDKEALRTKAVPRLVDFLDEVGGRLGEDCADALRRITGKNLGKDSPPWRKWMAGGDAAVEKAPEPKAADSGYGETKPHFYGMDVVSRRFVIVFDKSLSMYDPIELDRDRLRRETSRRHAVTGDEKKAPDDAKPEDVGFDLPWWEIKSRLDLARWQAINLVSRLSPEQSFEIITFSTQVDPWMSRLVPANQANKLKAIEMLKSLKADGETNTWGALAAAFEMSAANVRTGGANAPDAIYFVTDGAPSKGDIVDGNQIHDAVVQLAKVHQMQVNVIGVGVNLTFLRKIAVSTGGQCKFF